MAYASRALTTAKTHYAQIEKELLAIVFACQHFDAYIFGREHVQGETDHKPLVSIVDKPLYKAPSRLQKMLLKLQRYNTRQESTCSWQTYLAVLTYQHPVGKNIYTVLKKLITQQLSH